MIKQVKYKDLLIVEDQEELRRSIAAYFSEHNSVTECSTLADAIRAVRETAYDAILLDVILPDGSGLKLLEHTEETPVIILSNLGADSNLLDGFSAGATDYILKPASKDIIESRVSLHLSDAARGRAIHGKRDLRAGVEDALSQFRNHQNAPFQPAQKDALRVEGVRGADHFGIRKGICVRGERQ